jgi:hypothetical protein
MFHACRGVVTHLAILPCPSRQHHQALRWRSPEASRTSWLLDEKIKIKIKIKIKRKQITSA